MITQVQYLCALLRLYLRMFLKSILPYARTVQDTANSRQKNGNSETPAPLFVAIPLALPRSPLMAS